MKSINSEDITFIKKNLDRYFSKDNTYSFMHVEERVPKDMRDGEVDEDGWVKWKLIESKVSTEEITKIEDEFSIKLPTLFKAYLKTYHYIEINLKNIKVNGEYKGDCRYIEMPSLSTEDGLQDLYFNINSWKPLIHAGYIPFADCEDGQGPICFDTQRKNQNNDCPIVWFLHDHLHRLGEEKSKNRSNLLPYVNELFDSFRDLIVTLCSN